MTTKPKVFCIGFHKTGTTTMKVALDALGYRVTGPDGVSNPNIESDVYDMARDLVSRFDAFQDNPWPIIYKFLDTTYPGSKFILTTRDPQSWIESQKKHFGTDETPMRKWIYGTGSPIENEDIYIERYISHNSEVVKYFENREDLLVMDLAQGDGWDKLCSFLDMDIPDIPFPHANKSSDRTRRKKLTTRVARKAKLLIERISGRAR